MIKLIKPPCRFGIEYTFIRKDGKRIISHTEEDRLIASYKACGLKHQGDLEAQDGAFEASSPIFSNVNQFLKHDTKIRKWAKKKDLVPRLIEYDKDGTETHIGDGGGHIHLELPKSDIQRLSIILNFVEFYVKKAWPTWFFNAWYDNTEARPLRYDERGKRYLLNEGRISISRTKVIGNRLIILTPTDLWGCDKESNAINFRQQHTGDTIEFRHFRAAANKEEQILHLNFVFSLYKLLKSETNKTWAEKNHKDSPIDLICNFNTILVDLGLNCVDYKQFVDNFMDRINYGKLR